MVRKVTMVLVLVLTTLLNTPVFAQEATSGGVKVYLPLINSGKEPSAAAEEGVAVNLTDTMDGVDAAASDGSGVVFVTTNANDPIRGNEIVMYRRRFDGDRTLPHRRSRVRQRPWFAGRAGLERQWTLALCGECRQ